MLVYEILLLLSTAYLVSYAGFCKKNGHNGPAFGAALLSAVPAALLVTLVCIS